MSPRPWEIISSKEEGSFGIFSIRRKRARSPRTAREHDFIILECPSWVNVIPVTTEGKVVMIHQWRHGIGGDTLEIPGGVVEHGDTPLLAAHRELREETGYLAEDMVPVGFVHPNPAFMDNRCYTYVAEGATLNGSQELDDKEDIDVVLMEPLEIPALIRNGVITHSLVVVAFYRYFMEYLSHEPA